MRKIVSGIVLSLVFVVGAFGQQSGASVESKGAPFAKGHIAPLTQFYGTYSYAIASGQAILKADSVQNTSASPATLRFALWFTPNPWPSSGYNTARYNIGTLSPGQTISGVNSAGTGVPYTDPPAGCYYVTLVLEENVNGSWLTDDYGPFSKKFDIFGGCISSFAANPASITAGTSSTLSWVTLGGSPSIDNGIGAVAASGSSPVQPSATTTYTLSINGLADSFPPTRTATVTVTTPTPAPTAAFTVIPVSITQGDSATLSWSTSNATSVTIDHGIGSVAAIGSMNIHPTTTTMYTLTASGAGGTITRSATLTVTAACGSPAIATLVANPASVIAGEPVSLSVTVSSGSSISYQWFRGNSGVTSASIGTGPTITTSEAEGTNYWVRVTDTACGTFTDSASLFVPLNTGSCVTNDQLCINNNRYRATLSAKDPSGHIANGVALYQTNSFGFFSLPSFTGDSKNPEVFLKILGPVNGVPWIFYSGLTNLDYTISIVDTTTGATLKSYHVAPPAAGSAQSKGNFDVNGATSTHCDGVTMTTRVDTPAACPDDGASLCLLNRRYRVTLSAHDDPARTGKTAPGYAVSRSDAFGFFSVPGLSGDAKNLEVFVKMVDARGLAGHMWVFLGGLTDLEYTVTITDTITGQTRIYNKPLFSTCGWNDTSAF